MPLAAHAHQTTATITCSQVSFFFEGFPPSGVNTIQERVSIDGVVVANHTHQFVGSFSSNNIMIDVPEGTHTVDVHAEWDGNGARMTYDTSETITCECSITLPNMSTATANGNAYVLRTQLLGAPPSKSATAASTQTGPGTNSTASGPTSINLTGPINVQLMRSKSSSKVDRKGSSDESLATAASVNILNLVTAPALRANARAFASPTDAGYSFAGTMIEGLNIAGTVINQIYPNQVVPLPGGGTVTLLETVATATKTNGIAKADLTINLIHVRIPASRLGLPTDIVVGHAEAHARSPMAILCEEPNGWVGAEAFAAKVSRSLHPEARSIVSNYVSIPRIGGASSVAAQTFQVVRDDGYPVGSGTVSQQVSGIVNATTARALANSTVEGMCLFTTTPCDPISGLWPTDGIAVSLVTAAANSRASGGSAASWTSGSTFATIWLGNQFVNPTNMPPNTVYNLPGIGTVIINETLPNASNNNETDNGVTVNMIHIRTLPLNQDIIISSARTEAHHQ
jgi:hypothetical protein